jgi:hypothetical protein
MELAMNKIFLIIIFFVIGTFVLFDPQEAQANVPHVDGYVRNSQTGAGIPNVWVAMHTNGCFDTSYCAPCNSGAGTRYELTNNQGKFRFDGLDISKRDSRFGNMIDTNFDGTNDAQQIPLILGCISPIFGVPDYTYYFQCHGAPFNFFVVKPVGWTGTFSTVSGIDLNNVPGETIIDIDMTYSPPLATPTPTPTPIPTYTITGKVFVDTNRDGVKQAAEAIFPGTIITLSGTSTGTNTTNATGDYLFTNRLAGNYTVTMTVPAGYTATTPVSGGRTLGPNATLNFGIALLYTVTGNIFIDANKNGLRDNGETNYPGVPTVAVSRGTVITGSGGYYKISNLSAGPVTVSYTSLPTDYFMTSPKNGPPPSFQVIVGPGCSTNNAVGASCQ